MIVILQKNIMKKNNLLFLLFLIIISSKILAQEDYSIEYNYTDRTGHHCLSKLIIHNNEEAVFKIFDDRESGIGKNPYTQEMLKVVNDELSTFTYSTNSKIYTRVPYKNGIFAYSYPSDHHQWRLTGKSKKIKGYQCQEAVLKLHERTYTVWFTSEIPVNFGPLKLNGLPGLIVKGSDDKKYFSFSLLNIKKSTDQKVFNFYKDFFKKNQKVYNYSNYKKALTTYLTNSKRKKLVMAAEMQVTMTFDDNQRFFTQHFIDLPENLITELKKIN